MLRAGATNQEIQAHCKEKYGKGISTQTLANYRKDMREKDSTRQQALARAGFLLSEGRTRNAAQIEIKKLYGVTLSYKTLNGLMPPSETAPPDPEPRAPAGAGPEAVTALTVPTEVLTSTADDLESRLEQTYQWMKALGVETLNISGGEATVTFKQRFNLGGDTP